MPLSLAQIRGLIVSGGSPDADAVQLFALIPYTSATVWSSAIPVLHFGTPLVPWLVPKLICALTHRPYVCRQPYVTVIVAEIQKIHCPAAQPLEVGPFRAHNSNLPTSSCHCLLLKSRQLYPELEQTCLQTSDVQNMILVGQQIGFFLAIATSHI